MYRSNELMSIEEALKKWDESVQRILEIVKKASDEGVEFSMDLKNILYHVTNLNNEILQELNNTHRKLLKAIKDIQNTTTGVER
jgi:hypothetical protein